MKVIQSIRILCLILVLANISGCGSTRQSKLDSPRRPVSSSLRAVDRIPPEVSKTELDEMRAFHEQQEFDAEWGKYYGFMQENLDEVANLSMYIIDLFDELRTRPGMVNSEEWIETLNEQLDDLDSALYHIIEFGEFEEGRIHVSLDEFGPNAPLVRAHVVAACELLEASIPLLEEFVDSGARNVEVESEIEELWTSASAEFVRAHNISTTEHDLDYLTTLAIDLPVITDDALADAAAQKANIAIFDIFYNGEKGPSEPDEFVVVENSGTVDIDLTGWRINAGAPGQDFYFPDFFLRAGASVRVYTNEDHTAERRLNFGSDSAIWRNKGDCGYLFDDANTMISEFCYGSTDK